VKKYLSLIFLRYIRFFAKAQLLKIRLVLKLQGNKLVTIGITGSAGKTSTLLATEATLKPNFKVKTNYGGNSESGIPLNILGLSNSDFSLFSWFKILILSPLKLITNWQTYNVYLIEMGIDSALSPNNMSYLLSIIRPEIGVFLNITPVHLENFTSLDQIAQEKAKLVNSATTAIINANDPLVKKYTTNPNTISIKPVNVNIPNHLLPNIYHISFGTAICIGQILGLSRKSLIINLKSNFKLPPSRSSVFKGVKSSTIIDSSYNSSPLATTEMLKFLNTFNSPKIAILGDMRELGKQSPQAHRQLYRHALKTTDTIITVGPQTKQYFGPKAIKFDYWWQALKHLEKHLPQKSTILVKGSQNTIYLEEIVKGVLKNPSDQSKLCRQSPYWQQIKTNFYQANFHY
jgi:UDP-N-acetylmuramoyl-tripeptide--D-alanyl-D-alanine ligase